VAPASPALARHPLAIAGALLATVSAVVFVALLIAALMGLLNNPYAGLVVFVVIPAFFVLGLLLIPLGMWLQRRKLRAHPDAAVDWPVLDFRSPRVRKTTLLITALTAVNLVILLLAGYGSLHWMESPTFCGQACHTPMQPQFMAWQTAAHGRVACVDCHIGEGAGSFLHAKLSGVRQLVQVAGNSYPRPIPPGAHMQPGAQAGTCVSCHPPARATGDHVRVVREYADDEANTETATILRMHLGAGSVSGRAIHWHADPAVRVEYVATDATNETIPYVRVTNANGQVKEFRAADTTDQTIAAGPLRRMDCIDCHNTVGHPISPTPERAVDGAIAAGLVSRQLPFVRREGVKLVTASYSSQDEAAAAIERGLRAFYDSRGGTDQQAVARSAAALQEIYRRNVFPGMKVTWGTYPTNRGHMTSTGCFRCHDDSHTAKDGATISADCEYCHKQVER
jgi:NapC/NirT cytochrome c family, N-terminal region